MSEASRRNASDCTHRHPRRCRLAAL